MNTAEFLKRTIAFTMGAIELSADRLKQFTDDMVARGEMSSEEARKFIDDVSKRADEDKQTMQNWMREQSIKMVQQVGAADVERVEKLERRIDALEARIASLQAAQATQTAQEEDMGQSVCVVDPVTGQCAHDSVCD